jgi:hypothetical protein
MSVSRTEAAPTRKEQTMHKPTIAGAIALVVAPVLAIAGIAVSPTMSNESADQVTALTAHHSAVILGLTLQTLAAAVLIAGIAWLALVVRQRSARLALAGGALGIGGLLIVLFQDGVSATAPAIVSGLDHTGATAILDRIHSGALSGLEPLSLLGDIGLAILGIAAVKAGAARWTAPAIAVGALGGGVGFATGSKPLLLIAFTVLLVGLAAACIGLLARPAPAVQPAEVVVPAG